MDNRILDNLRSDVDALEAELGPTIPSELEELKAELAALRESRYQLERNLTAKFYRYRKLARALMKLPAWGPITRLDVIYVLCDVLEEDNPRFQPGMFMDWALEDV